MNQPELSDLERELIDENRECWRKIDVLRDGLMYIRGADVAGYDGHMRPEEAALKAIEDAKL